MSEPPPLPPPRHSRCNSVGAQSAMPFWRVDVRDDSQGTLNLSETDAMKPVHTHTHTHTHTYAHAREDPDTGKGTCTGCVDFSSGCQIVSNMDHKTTHTHTHRQTHTHGVRRSSAQRMQSTDHKKTARQTRTHARARALRTAKQEQSKKSDWRTHTQVYGADRGHRGPSTKRSVECLRSPTSCRHCSPHNT